MGFRAWGVQVQGLKASSFTFMAVLALGCGLGAWGIQALGVLLFRGSGFGFSVLGCCAKRVVGCFACWGCFACFMVNWDSLIELLWQGTFNQATWPEMYSKSICVHIPQDEINTVQLCGYTYIHT